MPAWWLSEATTRVHACPRPSQLTTLGRQMTFIYEPRKVPFVLSPDEVRRFLEAAPGLKYKAALSS